MDLTEHTLTSESVWEGRLLHVRRDTVRLPNGQEGVREYIQHPGAVVIIPVLPDGRLLFERQHRYPIRQTVLELPAGKIDSGESIESTAQRELLEETGYTAGQWRYLGRMHPCIGYADERIEIFLAQDLVRSAEQALDEGEFLDILPMDIKDAIDAVRTGVLTDAKTITALFWAERVLDGRW